MPTPLQLEFFLRIQVDRAVEGQASQAWDFEVRLTPPAPRLISTAMAMLDIIVAPDPRLKKKAVPVATVDPATAKLMDDMLETMYEAPGVGLAAPQVGVLKRIIVCDPHKEGEERRPLKLVNPEIVWASDERKPYEEGCLSLPDEYENVVRPARIRVKYTDELNQPQELEAEGLLAVVIQHEMDHLEGVLFVDHISTLKRGIILRRLTKQKKTGKRAVGE